MSSLHPHSYDKYIGERIKELRLTKGMTQEDLGKLLGVSFQQIQKYEKGSNRIAVYKLLELSIILSVPVTYLLPEPDIQNNFGEYNNKTTLHDNEDTFEHGHYPESKEILVLVREYTNIKDKKIRSAIYSLIKSLSQNKSNESVKCSTEKNKNKDKE